MQLGLLLLLHVPPPPDQPAKDEPALGAAVSVTCVPKLKLLLQVVVGQLIPAGLLVTNPEPDPASITLSVLGAKVAVTA